MKHFFLILALVGFHAYIKAQTSEFSLDLSGAWRVYLHEVSTDIPYNELVNTSVVYQKLPISNLRNSNLVIDLEDHASVFIDNKIVNTSINDKAYTLRLDLDSLRKIEDTLFIVYLKTQGLITSNPKIQVEYSRVSTQKAMVGWNTPNTIDFLKKSNSNTVLFFISVLFMLSMIYQLSPRVFGDLFGFKELFYGYKVDKLLVISRIDTVKLAYMVVSSILYSVLYCLIFANKDIDVMTMLSLTVKVFVLFSAKLLALYLSSWLYKRKGLFEPHFYVFLKLMFTLAIIGISVVYLTRNTIGVLDIFQSNIPLIVTTVFIANLLIQYFVIKSVGRLYGFYLFSYLCITEIVPFLMFYSLWFRFL